MGTIFGFTNTILKLHLCRKNLLFILIDTYQKCSPTNNSCCECVTCNLNRVSIKIVSKYHRSISKKIQEYFTCTETVFDIVCWNSLIILSLHCSSDEKRRKICKIRSENMWTFEADWKSKIQQQKMGNTASTVWKLINCLKSSIKPHQQLGHITNSRLRVKNTSNKHQQKVSI